MHKDMCSGGASDWDLSASEASQHSQETCSGLLGATPLETVTCPVCFPLCSSMRSLARSISQRSIAMRILQAIATSASIVQFYPKSTRRTISEKCIQATLPQGRSLPVGSRGMEYFVWHNLCDRSLDNFRQIHAEVRCSTGHMS